MFCCFPLAQSHDAFSCCRSLSATEWNRITLFHLRVSALSCKSLHLASSPHQSLVDLSRRYDERLRRWGADKQTHAFELASKSFEFLVVPLAGIVHQPHESFKFWSRDSNILCAKVEC